VNSQLQKENRKTVITFYRRADQKYDSSVKQIFLILDNVSIHKSNKVKETLVDITKTYLVFPPTTRSPKLNQIEVRWLWMNRQVINNSTFLNGQDIGKAISDRACTYNKKHAGRTSNIR